MGKSLQINGMFYKSCYVMNIIIALPSSFPSPLSPSLPPSLPPFPTSCDTLYNEYMNMYWLSLSLPPLPPSPYMYMYKYTCSTCTYLNCITVTRSTPFLKPVSVSVPGGPTFTGTPELQSIMIKLNNTKLKKKIQNFYTYKI